MLQQVGRVEASHAAQDVEEAGRGAALAVPCLPQVQDGLGGARPRREERDVAVDVEALGQQPPVVAEADGGVQHPDQGLLGGGGQAEGGGRAVGVTARAAAGAGPLLAAPPARARAVRRDVGGDLQQALVGVPLLVDVDRHGEAAGPRQPRGSRHRRRK